MRQRMRDPSSNILQNLSLPAGTVGENERLACYSGRRSRTSIASLRSAADAGALTKARQKQFLKTKLE